MTAKTIHTQGLPSFIDQAKDARTLSERRHWLAELLSWISEAKPKWRPALAMSAVEIAERSLENSAAMAHILTAVLGDLNDDLGIALLIALRNAEERRLLRRISKRMAVAGENFVARTRAQYLKLLRAGTGGGIITCVTVVAKSWIFWLSIPVFLSGALISLNYAISFLVIYLLGFKLVTKQPAIAASAFAKVIASRAPIGYWISILRSLAMTAVTNVAAVTASVIAFHFTYRSLHHGRSFLDARASDHILHALDPLHSLTIPAAALTGVLLWLSSIIGGWFEDRALLHSQEKPRHVFGVASSISLGLLFGALSILGSAFGLQLSVRHMTLSTGALVLGACSLGFHGALTSGLVTAAAGLAIVTILNLGVAFALGFVTAV